MKDINKKREISMEDFVNVKYPLIKRLHELGIKNGNEIMLFCKILHLQSKGNGCTASNDYFSGLFCLSDRQIREYLSDLKSKGLIKTYEKKLGLKTTTRYIYVQYDMLEAEDILQSSDEPAEETRQTSGGNTSKERKKYVRPVEDNFHHIIEDNRLEKNNIDELADARAIASQPVKEKINMDVIDFNSQNKSISNEQIKNAINGTIEDNRKRYSDEEIIRFVVRDFSCAPWLCDKKSIATYVNGVFGISEVCEETYIPHDEWDASSCFC